MPATIPSAWALIEFSTQSFCAGRMRSSSTARSTAAVAAFRSRCSAASSRALTASSRALTASSRACGSSSPLFIAGARSSRFGLLSSARLDSPAICPPRPRMNAGDRYRYAFLRSLSAASADRSSMAEMAPLASARNSESQPLASVFPRYVLLVGSDSWSKSIRAARSCALSPAARPAGSGIL